MSISSSTYHYGDGTTKSDPGSATAAVTDDRIDSWVQNISNADQFFFASAPLSTNDVLFFFEYTGSGEEVILIESDGTQIGSGVEFAASTVFGKVDSFPGSFNLNVTLTAVTFGEFGVTDAQLADVAGIEINGANLDDPMLIGFTAPDQPPETSSLAPEDNDTAWEIQQYLFATFNEPVSTNTEGSVVITNYPGGSAQTYAAGSDKLQIVNGNQLRIEPDPALSGSSDYAVLISTNLIKDTAGNFFAGITNTTGWNFTTTTPDTDAPLATVTNPVDGATGVIGTNKLYLTFNENVNADGAGGITISNVTASTATNFPATDGKVSVTTSNVTITPPNGLAADSDYVILVDTNAFKDGNDNYFAGITNASDWTFSTDGDAPLKSGAFDPPDEATRRSSGHQPGGHLQRSHHEWDGQHPDHEPDRRRQCGQYRGHRRHANHNRRRTPDDQPDRQSAGRQVARGAYPLRCHQGHHRERYAGFTDNDTWNFTTELTPLPITSVTWTDESGTVTATRSRTWMLGTTETP